jgi:pyruvate dehydrogenase E1 component
MVPEALRASDDLLLDSVFASVFNCVSPDRAYRAWQSHVPNGLDRSAGLFGEPSPPVVTIIDGHPSTLAWVGSAFGVRSYRLGVVGYGQSGTPEDLYREFRIDHESIVLAAFTPLRC